MAHWEARPQEALAQRCLTKLERCGDHGMRGRKSLTETFRMNIHYSDGPARSGCSGISTSAALRLRAAILWLSARASRGERQRDRPALSAPIRPVSHPPSPPGWRCLTARVCRECRGGPRRQRQDTWQSLRARPMPLASGQQEVCRIDARTERSTRRKSRDDIHKSAHCQSPSFRGAAMLAGDHL